jgi:hypothetical protein
VIWLYPTTSSGRVGFLEPSVASPRTVHRLPAHHSPIDAQSTVLIPRILPCHSFSILAILALLAMPSISPPPGGIPTRRGPTHKLSNPSLSAPQQSGFTASYTPTRDRDEKPRSKESLADTRLHERGHGPIKSVSTSGPAFGGPRRGSMRGEGKLRRREWLILAGVMVVAAGVRLWRLWQPTSVV